MSLTNAIINEQRWKLKRPLITCGDRCTSGTLITCGDRCTSGTLITCGHRGQGPPSTDNASIMYINKYLTTMIDLDYIDEVVLRWGKKGLDHTITSIVCIALTVDLGVLNAWSFKDNIHESVITILNNYNM